MSEGRREEDMLEVAVQCVLGVREGSNENEGSQRVSMHAETGRQRGHVLTHSWSQQERSSDVIQR